MANTQGPYGARPYRSSRSSSGFPVEVEAYTGTAPAQGDPLTVDSSTGKVKIHTAAGVESIIGFCAFAPQSHETVVSYYPADPETVFVAQSYQSTALTQAYMHLAYEFGGTTGAFGINTSATAHPVVKVLGFHPETTIGAYADLLFIVQKSGYTGQGDFQPGL